MVQRDDDYIAFLREIAAVVGWPRAGAVSEAAAMQPHHDGTFAVIPVPIFTERRPHIQEQAVLAAHLHFRESGIDSLQRLREIGLGFFSCCADRYLHSRRTEVHAVCRIGPW